MRRAILVPVGAAISGIAVIQLANGFLGTLVSVTSAAAGFSPLTLGIVLAAYFGGYTIGAATIMPILQRVGHIRMFGALAGLVAACIALQPVLTSPAAWICIRLVTGFGCSGLFITAESWLSATASPQNRGSIFAIYMVATNAAFGLGQFFLNIPAPGGFELFSLAAALFCIALIPVSLTRSTPPAIVKSPKLTLWNLRRLAPVAFAGCATSGLISSAFYSLVPAFAHNQGVSSSVISAYIATAIFGGLFFQLPVGRISDTFDRRAVAAALATCLSASALVLALVPLPGMAVFGLTFVLGGFMSTIYPVCVAHANDRVGPERVVSTSGTLILINGVSSFLGPIVGITIMGKAGIEGVYLYMSILAAVFIAITLWRMNRVKEPNRKGRSFVILDERMGQPLAHVASEIRATTA